MHFRVECPKCGWGYAVKDAQINAGFIRVTCDHCRNRFWFKLTLSDINLKVSQDLPEGYSGDGITWLGDMNEAEED
jgi:predicted Zn finger-like uncharacterized protein